MNDTYIRTSLESQQVHAHISASFSMKTHPSTLPASFIQGQIMHLLRASKVNMQAMDLLLLPVLLQLLLAQHRPHEVHSGQGHESH